MYYGSTKKFTEWNERDLNSWRVTADGFVISPNGDLRNFTQEDIWEVT